MQCSFCKASITDTQVFCPACGKKNLTGQVGENNHREPRTIVYCIVGFTALLMSALWFSALNKPLPESTHKAVSTTMQVNTADMPCGQSVFDVAEAVKAARDGDVIGYVSLSERKGILLLDKGTEVDVIGEPSYTMSFVNIAKGIHRGQTCWIPERALTPTQ